MQGVGWISVGKVLETNFSTSGYLFDLLELEFWKNENARL